MVCHMKTDADRMIFLNLVQNVPVSYTHLDVYKRQIIHIKNVMWLQFCIIGESEI